MHIQVLIEDASGKIAMEPFLEKILGPNGREHTYDVKSYKGCGRIPPDLKTSADPSKRILLDQLPRLLQGYGKTFASYGKDYSAAVVVVVDLDKQNCLEFKQELLTVLDNCQPKPNALFRIAIEEGEAWLMGDMAAIQRAYPNAATKVLEAYQQDSICGTWEVLADAIYPGGSQKLINEGWPKKGQMKCQWAENIAPLVNIDANLSPSFRAFRDGVRKLAGIAAP